MNKAKKLIPVRLSDCKKEYDKDGKNRYVIIDSLAIQVSIFLCKTYKEAEEQVKWFREMGLYPSAIIVDLEEWGEWKPVYDKEPMQIIEKMRNMSSEELFRVRMQEPFCKE